MKVKLVIIFFVGACLSSCSTYYLCKTGSEVQLYSEKSTSSKKINIIPKGSVVIVKGNKRFRKVKYNNTIGWSYSPIFSSESIYKKGIFGFKKKKKSTYSSGTVHVRGYYRKDGTYVRSHTRRKRKY